MNPIFSLKPLGVANLCYMTNMTDEWHDSKGVKTRWNDICVALSGSRKLLPVITKMLKNKYVFLNMSFQCRLKRLERSQKQQKNPKKWWWIPCPKVTKRQIKVKHQSFQHSRPLGFLKKLPSQPTLYSLERLFRTFPASPDTWKIMKNTATIIAWTSTGQRICSKW